MSRTPRHISAKDEARFDQRGHTIQLFVVIQCSGKGAVDEVPHAVRNYDVAPPNVAVTISEAVERSDAVEHVSKSYSELFCAIWLALKANRNKAESILLLEDPVVSPWLLHMQHAGTGAKEVKFLQLLKDISISVRHFDVVHADPQLLSSPAIKGLVHGQCDGVKQLVHVGDCRILKRSGIRDKAGY